MDEEGDSTSRVSFTVPSNKIIFRNVGEIGFILKLGFLEGYNFDIIVSDKLFNFIYFVSEPIAIELQNFKLVVVIVGGAAGWGGRAGAGRGVGEVEFALSQHEPI